MACSEAKFSVFRSYSGSVAGSVAEFLSDIEGRCRNIYKDIDLRYPDIYGAYLKVSKLGFNFAC